MLNCTLGLTLFDLEVPALYEPFAYSYKYFPHAPLNWYDAKRCLRQLVVGVNTALTKLQSQNVRHNDLRLDNICFDEQFRPCFIDFDRSSARKVQACKYFDGYGNSSCMYNLDNPEWKDEARDANTDYMQLGWMVAWLFVDKELDYHSRQWEPTVQNAKCEPIKVKQNKFISTLIEKRQFDERLLSCLPEDVSTLKDVLEARSPPRM